MASSDDPSRREGRYDRRELIRRAGAAGISIGVAGSGFGQAFYGPLRFKGRWLKGDLTIIQWAHFVPAYDKWFDDTWAKNWGQKNDVQVHVDHILNTLLPARAAAEAASGSGHDLFFNLSPQAQFEDQVINHAEIVQEVQHKVGKIGGLAKRATYNPKTKKWFAFADNYVPDPVVWRHDYWNGVGIASIQSGASWGRSKIVGGPHGSPTSPLLLGSARFLFGSARRDALTPPPASICSGIGACSSLAFRRLASRLIPRLWPRGRTDRLGDGPVVGPVALVGSAPERERVAFPPKRDN